MSETLKNILISLGSILGSISLGTVINVVSNAIRMTAIKKFIEKNNNQELAREQGEKAVLQTVEQIKNISFKQNIQPIVESGLEKVNEKSREFIEKALEKVEAKYDKLLNVLENLASYFDNSIGVSDTAKENLKKAIKEAKIQPVIDNNIEVEEIVVEQEIEPKKTKSSIKVQR